MADKNKNGSSVEKEKTSSTTIERPEKQEGQLPREIIHIKEKEKEIKSETAAETSELKREKLGEEIVGPDRETAEKIASIDIAKESSEQKDKWGRMDLAISTLLTKLFDKGFKKELLDVLESFAGIQVDETVPLNGVEKITLKKLKEIASNTASPLFLELKNKWQALTDKAYLLYQKSAKARDYLMAPEGAESKEKEPWLIRKMKEHPYAAAIGLATGAYGIYEIFFSDDKKEPEKEKSSLMDSIGLGSWKGKLLVGALGVLAVGGYIGRDKIGDVIKKLTDFSGEKIDKVLALVKEGKYLEAIKTLFLTDVIAEKGKEALDWLDDKLNFSGMKDRITAFCTEHHITLPDWIKNASLSEIAKDLGIDKMDKTTWMEYAVAGGGALLLYKWAGKKGLMAAGLNAGIYLFIVREGKDSFGGKLISTLTKEIDTAKSAILKKVKDIPGADFLISDAIEGFSVQNSIDGLLQWMKENPMEGMAIMNGLWFCRGLVYKTLKLFLKAGGNLAAYAFNNPGKTAIAGGVLLALYEGRRKYIKDIVEALYDNPQSKEAKASMAEFDSLLDVDRTKKESLVEHQTPQFIQTILEDPIKAFNLKETIDAYKEGKIAIGVDIAGKVLLIWEGFSAPVILTKLTKDALKSLPFIYSDKNDESVIMPTVIAGTEVLAFGSAAWKGFRAYETIWKMADRSIYGKVWHMALSLTPGTPDWFFVWKTVLRTPLLSVEKVSNSLQAARMQKALKKIVELAMEKTPSAMKEIVKIAHGLSSRDLITHYRDIENGLKGTGYGWETAQKIAVLRKNLDSILAATQIDKADEVINFANKNNQILKELNLRLLHRLKVATLVSAGKIQEAMAYAGKMKEVVTGGAKAVEAGAEAAEAGTEAAEVGTKAVGTETKVAEAAEVAAAKGAKGVETGVKTVSELEKALITGKKVAVTAAEVSKFGLKVARLKEFAWPVVKIGGKVFVVVDAVWSVYDVYDQATKLGQMLSSENITEISKIPDAISGIAGHVESIEKGQREKEVKAANDVMAAQEPEIKLAGARNFAISMKAKMQCYGISRQGKDVGEKSVIATAEEKIGGGLGYVLTGWAMDLALGGSDSNLRHAEQVTLQTSSDQAERIVDDLKKIQPQTREIEATIRALEIAIELTKKTIKEDKAPPEKEIIRIDKEIGDARIERMHGGIQMAA